MPPAVKHYALVTGNYWAFTLTDGALRMLVVLYFYGLGYSALEVALVFVLYELCGVITNLVGGWLGARIGLNRTMHIGLGLQIFALSLLLVPTDWLSVAWVMLAQAISGVAKDLNKMSAKSAIKSLTDPQGLFRWVAALTGSKNALKGVGYFLGAASLGAFGFQNTLLFMATTLTLVWVISLLALPRELGKASFKPKFKDLISQDPMINRLAAARVFLFGARDVWFVVALPVFLAQGLGWEPWQTGTLMASWVIGYGFIQAVTPMILRGRQTLWHWGLALTLCPAAMAFGLSQDWPILESLLTGLVVFGSLFAINSATHSWRIVDYSRADGTSLDVGFYYTANAMGRLIGTVLSGYLYQEYGLVMCLGFSAGMLALATLIAAPLDRITSGSNATSQ